MLSSLYVFLVCLAWFLPLSSSLHLHMMSHKARVEVLPSLGKVGQALCGDLVRSAREDIASKGSFFCAVPGGSVLKLLGALKDTEGASAVDWRAVHLFYVNHKCVHGEDPSSTHLKAKKLFLGHFEGIRAHPIIFSEAAAIGHDTVAHDYSKEIERTLPLGVFDYMLLGVGKDGHIGSLYPNRKELAETSSKVISCDKKAPPSVTLSLPLMNGARRIRVALMGDDKAEAAVAAVMKTMSKEEFPVCGIVDSDKVTFFLDEPAASLYKKRV